MTSVAPGASVNVSTAIESAVSVVEVGAAAHDKLALSADGVQIRRIAGDLQRSFFDACIARVIQRVAQASTCLRLV